MLALFTLCVHRGGRRCCSAIVEKQPHSVQPSHEVPLLRRVASAKPDWNPWTARRHILGGSVCVDGSIVLDPAAFVKHQSHVAVSGWDGASSERINAPPRNELYLKLFKPRGVICSHKAERLSKRPIISSFYPAGAHAVHYVGRLDRDSEGLLLLTSDGTFSRFASLPETHTSKEYFAVVYCGRDNAPPSDLVLWQLTNGVVLPDGPAKAVEAEVVDFHGKFACIRIVVTCGRHRMVRRMLRFVGYGCVQLLRTRVGSVGGVLSSPRLAYLRSEGGAPSREAVAAAAMQGDPKALLSGQFAHLEREEISDVYHRGLGWLQRRDPL